MALKIHNTLTNKKEEFKPLVKEKVSMYTCGPTVYGYAHIGNFRAYISADILKRYLEYKGYKVKQVMNLTDVDDKTIRDSNKAGVPLHEYTEKYINAFFEDMKTLNLEPADVFPRATEHIKEMTAMIKKLQKNGHTYEKEGSTYYRISTFKDYGKLSNIKIKELKAGARVDADEYEKEDAHDFVLWKSHKENEPFWETEIGKGRPGWHIECSAMSTKYLGETFDIHTGGVDLIFPHHENEIAQSEGANKKLFVKYWVHNEWLLVNGKKMSKSLGNFYTLRDLLEKGYKPKAIRYALLSAYYRQQLNFTLENLKAADAAVERLLDFVDKLESLKSKAEYNKKILKLTEETREKFEKSMDDDLNISEALGHIFELVKEANKAMLNNKLSEENAKEILDLMKKFDKVLGILEKEELVIEKEIEDLVEKREEARKNKDFKTADKIRDELKKKGYSIEDSSEGPRLKKL